MDDLNDIIKNKCDDNKTTLYNKYDPLSRVCILLKELDTESSQIDCANISWNKLLNGYKKKYIIIYLTNNDVDESLKSDIIRNMYNNQFNKHYNVEYDTEKRQIINIEKI